MITFKFQGWFQCRLATDPDPADEPRGISGYMRCLLGEPDFDRVIRFHNPTVIRSHTPEIGVFITKVIADNEVLQAHPLIGAKFNLEGNPIFYGNNGVIADDGEEPIVPLIISIRQGDELLQRPLSDKTPEYPFAEHRPNSIAGRGYTKPGGGFVFESSDICEQTGIFNMDQVRQERIERLEQDFASATDPQLKYNTRTRIDFLKARTTVQVLREFSARMHWNLCLKGNIANSIKSVYVPNEPWTLHFWMGGWDSDGLCGYVNGVLQLPTAYIP